MSSGVEFGESRKQSDDSGLEGTATLTNDAKGFVKTGFESEPVDIYLCVNYLPVKADYGSGRPEKRFNAFLYSPRIVSGYPLLENLVLQIEAGITLMDNECAQAYHSVKYETANFSRYSAEAGLHDVFIEPTILYFATGSFMLIAQARYERLLADAAQSPLTENENLITAKIFAVNNF